MNQTATARAMNLAPISATDPQSMSGVVVTVSAVAAIIAPPILAEVKAQQSSVLSSLRGLFRGHTPDSLKEAFGGATKEERAAAKEDDRPALSPLAYALIDGRGVKPTTAKTMASEATTLYRAWNHANEQQREAIFGGDSIKDALELARELLKGAREERKSHAIDAEIGALRQQMERDAGDDADAALIKAEATAKVRAKAEADERQAKVDRIVKAAGDLGYNLTPAGETDEEFCARIVTGCGYGRLLQLVEAATEEMQRQDAVLLAKETAAADAAKVAKEATVKERAEYVEALEPIKATA